MDRPEARAPGLAGVRGWAPVYQIQEQKVQVYSGLGPDLGLNSLVRSHPPVQQRVQVLAQVPVQEQVALALDAAWV